MNGNEMIDYLDTCMMQSGNKGNNGRRDRNSSTRNTHKNHTGGDYSDYHDSIDRHSVPMYTQKGSYFKKRVRGDRYVGGDSSEYNSRKKRKKTKDVGYDDEYKERKRYNREDDDEQNDSDQNSEVDVVEPCIRRDYKETESTTNSSYIFFDDDIPRDRESDESTQSNKRDLDDDLIANYDRKMSGEDNDDDDKNNVDMNGDFNTYFDSNFDHDNDLFRAAESDAQRRNMPNTNTQHSRNTKHSHPNSSHQNKGKIPKSQQNQKNKVRAKDHANQPVKANQAINVDSKKKIKNTPIGLEKMELEMIYHKKKLHTKLTNILDDTDDDDDAVVVNKSNFKKPNSSENNKREKSTSSSNKNNDAINYMKPKCGYKSDGYNHLLKMIGISEMNHHESAHDYNQSVNGNMDIDIESRKSFDRSKDSSSSNISISSQEAQKGANMDNKGDDDISTDTLSNHSFSGSKKHQNHNEMCTYDLEPKGVEVESIDEEEEEVERDRHRLSLGNIDKDMISFLQNGFKNDLRNSGMCIKKFLSTICPLCAYGSKDLKGQYNIELEKIKQLYRNKVLSADPETLAAVLCFTWNNTLFKPITRKGIPFMPLLYEIALDHIKKPHIIDAALIAKKEIESLRTIKNGLEQMIFVIEEEEEENEESDKRNESSKTQSRKRKASSNNTTRKFENKDDIEESDKPRKRIKYNPQALRDYILVSDKMRTWIHSKRNNTIFLTKRRQCFMNTDNSNSQIQLSS